MNRLEYFEEGVSPYHVVAVSKEMLKKAGFLELSMDAKWTLERGAGYYVSPYPSMLFAFRPGMESVRIATAHTDQPMLKLKPHPTMNKEGMLVANVESYGGMILHTWFDRPLHLAGRVVCKSENVFAPNEFLFDSEEAVAVIPSLAIHMDREVNKKNELKCQVHLLPLMGIGTVQGEDVLLEYIAAKLEIASEDILDYDLFFYNPQKPELVGLHKEMVVSPRLDNLTSCYSAIMGITETNYPCTCVAALFDHEEVGSRSKQGADSMLFLNFMEKMMQEMNQNGITQNLCRDTLIHNGFVLSLDVAHAFHPNYAAKSDPTTKTIMGNGIVIKTSGSQRYHSDSFCCASIKQLCEKYKIAHQQQINHSDIAGGTTLGPIVASYLPIPGIDAGVGMLAMHASCETAAIKDCEALDHLVEAFYSEA